MPLWKDEKMWLVCQALSAGSMRFKDIFDTIGVINTSALFYTIKEMMKEGYVVKILNEQGLVEYALTDKGKQLARTPYPERRVMTCPKCGYTWKVKYSDKLPRVCPRCKAYIGEVSEK